MGSYFSIFGRCKSRKQHRLVGEKNECFLWNTHVVACVIRFHSEVCPIFVFAGRQNRLLWTNIICRFKIVVSVSNLGDLRTDVSYNLFSFE